MARLPKNSWSVWGGFLSRGRKCEGFRLRIERGDGPDIIVTLKSEWRGEAKAEALIALKNCYEINDETFKWAYTEYWYTRYRKWVIGDVISHKEIFK